MNPDHLVLLLIGLAWLVWERVGTNMYRDDIRDLRAANKILIQKNHLLEKHIDRLNKRGYI